MSAATLDGRGNWERIARRIRVPLGFVFAAVFLWRARPSLAVAVLSLLLVIPGLLLRGYAAGYVKKNAELTQTGPYAYTRNPLYLGSMMAAFGFAAASRRWELVVLLAVLFLVIYLPVILSEEKFLRSHFCGLQCLCRARASPAASADARERRDAATGRFSAERYRRHHEYNSVMGAAALYAALVLLIALRAHFGAR